MRWAAPVLAGVLAVGLASCGKNNKEGDADAGDTVETVDDTGLDIAPDAEPDPEPDQETDLEEETTPDAEPDVEHDGADAIEDVEDDASTDAAEDPDGASDASGDVLSEPACVALDPYAYGWCDMLLGYGWDGANCVAISGCDCAPDCAHFFRSMSACIAACT
jgi:hypothetical protein